MAVSCPEHAHATDRPATAILKDVTAHPRRPGSSPGLPCPVPACIGQPPSDQSRFSSPLRNRIFKVSFIDMRGGCLYFTCIIIITELYMSRFLRRFFLVQLCTYLEPISYCSSQTMNVWISIKSFTIGNFVEINPKIA